MRRFTPADWEAQYQRFAAAMKRDDRALAHSIVIDSRRLLSSRDWQWLQDALTAEEPGSAYHEHHGQKWFIARLLEGSSIPRALLPAMLRAAILVHEASYCRWFIEPCSRTYGERIVVKLEEILQTGSTFERESAEMCLYWARRFRARKALK